MDLLINCIRKNCIAYNQNIFRIRRNLIYFMQTICKDYIDVSNEENKNNVYRSAQKQPLIKNH